MKTIKMISRLTATAFLLGLFSVFAAAQSSAPQLGVDTTSNVLNLTATVQKTVQLSITDGTDLQTSATSGVYALDFGTIDARGIANDKNLRFETNGDGTNYSALYKKQITLLPAFSGFGEGESAEIELVVTDNAEGLVREGATVGIGDATSEGDTFEALSGEAITREVGFKVLRTTPAGTYTPTLTYTLTVTPGI